VSALHPQARALLERVDAWGLPPLTELEPDAARAQAARVSELVGAGPELREVEELSIPVSGEAIAGRRYEPGDSTATVVWVHGGGWVISDLDTHDAMCRLLALESGCEVIALDYRRAPEHPFPVPLEDSWEALRWAAGQRPGRALVLGGDSAGGNMAAVCARRARDLGGPELALQVLVYPVTHCDFTRPSYEQYGDSPDTFLRTDEMRWFWDHYVSDPVARTNPEASPLRAGNFSELPPAVVLTAEFDPLRDEGVAYAEALRGAGVPVSHHHYDDMVHGFFARVNLLERGNEAVAQVGGEIRAAVVQAGAAV
jgi:acetyl esterase